MNISVAKIPGLRIFELDLHFDERGWFKENWNQQSVATGGLFDFTPSQNNISFNGSTGVTRGFHAEPWDKYVSVANGQVFCAWVDLREGQSFGNVFTYTIHPGVAVFIPKGVANAFQTLEPNVVYTYLVNGHWDEKAEYKSLNLSDESIKVKWPIPLTSAEISEKDRRAPFLRDIEAFSKKKIVILGASGQIGREVSKLFPSALSYSSSDCDITSLDALDSLPWPEIGWVINAAAYTKVDLAETPEGRRKAWEVNSLAVYKLMGHARKHGTKLIHFSSDYVFDGVQPYPYSELDIPNPQSEYGRSKFTGDLSALSHSKTYVFRCSWVVGPGTNFVNTIAKRAISNEDISIVADQFGRLTFAVDVAKAVKFFIDNEPPFGLYNLSSQGEMSSWYEIACHIYKNLKSKGQVSPIKYEDYSSGKSMANRPANSGLNISKITQTGFLPSSQSEMLDNFLRS